MLTAFHQAVLIQATVAHEVASNYRATPGVTVLDSSHPQSGPRHKPDELLAIYSGDVCGLPPVEGFCTYLSSARPIYRRLLQDGGLDAGFTNDEVDFFNDDRLDIAVGRIERRTTREALWYWPSTAVSIRVVICGGALGIWRGRRSRLPIM
jgi:hypothetical protein